ncbi:MAG TPA: NAD(P) transhydrogenase subunit beta, partial [Cytophagales bacterium]|nr:NAD(P) transhydrogenase subunit beta [Cytophagales bacterium]
MYLLSIILFILGLKRLSHPDTAKKGNTIAYIGMGLAIVVTILFPFEGANNNYGFIIGGLILGSIIGFIAAKKVKMTAMPEMVSLFNGLGGACSLFISLVEFKNLPPETSLASTETLTIIFAMVIGGIAFTGSMIAFGKLNGSLRDSLVLPAPQVVNLVLLLAIIGFSAFLMSQDSLDFNYVLILTAITLLYGVTFVTPIGGGDMPVVISLLNSLSGIAAAGAGLIYGNQVMVVGGILVGASGTILTVLMCEAMNRSLFNVIIGGFGTKAARSGRL